MDYRTLTYELVELPPVGDSLPVVSRKKTICPICRNQRREAIEALMYSGMPIQDQHRAAREMNCKTSLAQYKKHMAEHCDAGLSLNMKSALGFIHNPMSTEGMAKLLLADALANVMNGSIRIGNIRDLSAILSALDKREQYEYERQADMANNNESIDEAYRQLNAIMEAATDVMDTEQLRLFVIAAWQRGLNKQITDIIDVPIYSDGGDFEEVDMSGALAKYKK